MENGYTNIRIRLDLNERLKREARQEGRSTIKQLERILDERLPADEGEKAAAS